MARAEHAQKAEVILSLKGAARGAIDRVAGQGLGFEGGLAGVGDGFGGDLVADPVADVVGVASPLGGD